MFGHSKQKGSAMQILDYNDKEHVHVCLNCDTEFTVKITNAEEDEVSVDFCPCCGESLDEEENGFEDDEEDDLDLY